MMVCVYDRSDSLINDDLEEGKCVSVCKNVCDGEMDSERCFCGHDLFIIKTKAFTKSQWVHLLAILIPVLNNVQWDTDETTILQLSNIWKFEIQPSPKMHFVEFEFFYCFFSFLHSVTVCSREELILF